MINCWKIFNLRQLQFLSIVLVCILSCSCVHVPSVDEQLVGIKSATGLEPVTVEGATSQYLGKQHRGYKTLVRFDMGNVWGRYGARMAVGEVGRELGGIWSFLTGSYKSGVGSIVGSPFDRVLSQAIGQPISMVLILKHNKKNASRLDIVSNFSTIQPPDTQPKFSYIGLGAGSIYTADTRFARKLTSNRNLILRIENFRSQYVRVDDVNVSYMFAGSENEYSATIRNFGGYAQMLNAIMDSLADIADEI